MEVWVALLDLSLQSTGISKTPMIQAVAEQLRVIWEAMVEG